MCDTRAVTKGHSSIRAEEELVARIGAITRVMAERAGRPALSRSEVPRAILVVGAEQFEIKLQMPSAPPAASKPSKKGAKPARKPKP